MTTLTLKIEANEQSAAVYRNANQAEKRRIKALFQVFFEKAVLHDNARSAMYQALDVLHTEAEANGLTDELLEELLEDED